MLTAVAQDLGRVEGVEVVTLPGAGDPEQVFRELAAAADYTLVIAPEFDGILVDRCRWVLEAGGRLLGSLLAAVELTADKLALASALASAGIPTPPCFPVRGALPPFPAVLKPRYGAGSQGTCCVPRGEELSACLERTTAEMPGAEMLLQPLVAGQAASVAFLVGPRQQIALAPAAQHLSTDGRFRYEGGTVPLPPDLTRRAAALGLRAVRAVPGLRGYVGVDLVLGAAADGSADTVIEINPRLTTSYIGLRVLAMFNLVEALLRVVVGEPVAEPTWRPGPVRFYADGAVGGGP